MSQDAELMAAAINALKLLDAVYEHVDRVNAAGGAVTLQGVAACNTMLNSLNKNRPRINTLVADPLRKLIEARKEK